MPWCPQCKAEFREGFTRCSDCDTDLVDKLETTIPEEKNEQKEQWAFLATIEDDREIDIIESLLRSYGIPILRKYRWAGGFLKVVMGVSTYGVDIYVPASRLELGRALLESDPEDIIPE